MTEEKKLTGQVLEQQQEDNLVLAERMIEQLLPSFSESLLKLSNNQLRKLIRLLVQFPFVDPKKFNLSKEQKLSFMFGERLIYANMVKRARAELDRTFGEVEKEQNEAKQESVAENNGGESSNVVGSSEENGNSQV